MIIHQTAREKKPWQNANIDKRASISRLENCQFACHSKWYYKVQQSLGPFLKIIVMHKPKKKI